MINGRWRRCWAIVVLGLPVVLNACVPVRPAASTPPGIEAVGLDSEEYYRQLQAAGKPVLMVDAAKSLIVIDVHRAGRLARLGHEHVVASHDVRGWIAPDEGRADLVIPLDSLTVDETALRIAAGLDAELPPQAIDATQRNMLDKVLETSLHPLARVRITRDHPDANVAHIALTVHGITRSIVVPTRIAVQGNVLSADGHVSFRQSDFGIVPFSVLGGALQVEDRVDLRFHIAAVRSQP